MSHSTGINCSEKLLEEFAEAKSGNLRAIKVQIVEEQLVGVETKPAVGTFEEDFSQIEELFDEKVPCYMVYRTDKQSEAGGFEFLFMSHVPDHSGVRPKMLYAATRESFKAALGSQCFTDEMFGTVKADFDLAAYKAHVRHQNAEIPLTEQELLYQESRKVDLDAGEFVASDEAGVSNAHTTVRFPVSDAGREALRNITGTNNLVALTVDNDNETVEFVSADEVPSVADLNSKLDTEAPRFYFYQWEHQHEGHSISSLVFIFWCPENCAIRQRMMAATVKQHLIDAVVDMGIIINCKIEGTSMDDINETIVTESLHPTVVDQKKSFAKPKRPGQGRARLTRK
eukprot:TRINITY_DN5778_c0_g1_i1.p1 TRINITY_DN5778_c0_g1~~TRINITY_DN5778_c0_g1_i1.p1  ORF type:complete len:342 (-),score=110.41 TRINITY_DN5778_c0_g1_i1:35-1060(-)